MQTIDRILELLKDGKWHDLKEIDEEVGLPENKLEEIMAFFAEYEFIQLDKKGRKARLTRPLEAFLKKRGE